MNFLLQKLNKRENPIYINFSFKNILGTNEIFGILFWNIFKNIIN